MPPKVAMFSSDIDQQATDRPRHMGTGHYRLAVPAAYLIDNGWDVVLTWNLAAHPQHGIVAFDRDGVAHHDCAVIVVQRWMQDDGVRIAQAAKAAGQALIHDVDDWFWGIPTSNIAFQNAHPRTNPNANWNTYLRNLAASSALTVSTPYLADRLKKMGVRVPIHVIRNAIDIDRWDVLDPTDGPNVGWIGGIPWRGSDLALLRGVLGPFLDAHRLRFFHGGHADFGATAAQQIGLDPHRVVTHPLVGMDEYPHMWAPLDIALAPLEDSPFNRAKTALKGLEASASGLPFIASDLPEYRSWLKASRLASKPMHWARHLEELLDPVVRKEEGAANRARAEELSINRQWHQWASVYEGVV